MSTASTKWHIKSETLCTSMIEFHLYHCFCPLFGTLYKLMNDNGYFQVAMNMLREEGIASFYSGLGPSLLGIAPYIAVNFCLFDL